MDRLTALQFYARVVESGSFSQAARDLGVGQPAVSKQIAGLERRLGAQLVNRTPRGLRPTPAGADFYEAAVRVLRDLDDAESQVANGYAQPSGTVRVAVPPVLTSIMIVPKLPEFFASFPDIAVELVVSVRFADLVQEGIDLAVRVGTLESSGLVARRIGSVKLVTVASADYLAAHGEPATPSDLDEQLFVANQHLGATSDFRFRDGERPVVTPRLKRLTSDNPADMHAAVLAGLGIGQSARALFEAELRSGQMKEILADFAPDALPIHVLYASGRIPHRVRVLSDFIIECIDAQPSLRLEPHHSGQE